MKMRYVGESFFLGLTDGKIYEVIEFDADNYLVEDDEEDGTYLYSKRNPRPADGSSKGGKWEIVEE